MKNFINLGKNFIQLKFLAVLMMLTVSQAFCQTSTNIATSGTGSIWQDLPSTSSISNVSKSANTGINNGNITTDVVLTDVN